MPGIESMLGLLTKLQQVDLTITQGRCVRVRNKNVSCMRCVEACTSGCISYEDGELLINPERCISCGTCATACPTGAIEPSSPTDPALVKLAYAARSGAEGESVIACTQLLQQVDGLYDKDKLVAVPCLGRVDESLLVALAITGSTKVSLVHGACETCEHAKGGTLAREVCDCANLLLETWNQEPKIRLTGKLPTVTKLEDQGFDAGRRNFFAAVQQDAKTVATATAEYAATEALGGGEEEEELPRFAKVQADGTLPHHVPGRRRLLWKGLQKLGKPQDVMIDTRLWGHVIIDTEKCNACRMCATFCPTGALSKFDLADGKMGIDHHPLACVKCHCCEDLCMTGAISISEEVFATDIATNAYERYEMTPQAISQADPHKMMKTMKDLLGCDQVYER